LEISYLTGPLYLRPIMMERVWGGNRLDKILKKQLPLGKLIGESWELSDRPEVQSTVSGGLYDGKTVEVLIREIPDVILGTRLVQFAKRRFPLLVKYIDAGTALSVQVHPDDNLAQKFNDRGKSECWVVLHVEPGASIVRGLRRGTTRGTYEAALAGNNLESVLHTFSPRAGDVVALPAGMIHASGAGLVLAEIQQNSDLTFRLFDYNRLGLDGKPRKLHQEEALKAIRFDQPGTEFSGDMFADTVTPRLIYRDDSAALEFLLEGRYFDLYRYTIAPRSTGVLPVNLDAPRVLMAISGSGALGGRPLGAGQTVLLPAALPELKVHAGGDPLTLLLSSPKIEAF
jgi:mannose-6-phosphate isomerase